MKQWTPSIDPEMIYNGMKLSEVTHFTYLGATLFYNGKIFMAQKRLSEQAMKAIFAFYSSLGKSLQRLAKN